MYVPLKMLHKLYVQGSPRVMIANCYGEHAPFGPAFRGFSVSAFRSLHVSFEQDIAYFVDHSGNERPLDFYSQSPAFSCFHSQSCRKNPSRNPGPNPNWRLTHFHRRRNLSYSSITINPATTNQPLGLSSGILRLQKENNNFWIKN